MGDTRSKQSFIPCLLTDKAIPIIFLLCARDKMMTIAK